MDLSDCERARQRKSLPWMTQRKSRYLSKRPRVTHALPSLSALPPNLLREIGHCGFRNAIFAPMEGQGEAVADVVTGGIVAQAVEPATGAAHVKEHHGPSDTCRNCGASLNGAYCANCGQAAHLHRSLLSLGHDILHGVFHFEGKIWRTIPELFFRPGRLTRRYIDGERAKFVSPMALYLFTVFLMFAVFSFTSGPSLLVPESIDFSAMRDWKANIEAQIERIDGEVEGLQEQLASPDLPASERTRLEKSIADQQATREAMEAMISGDVRKMMEFEQKQAARSEAEGGSPNRVNLGGRWPTLEQRLTAGLHLSRAPLAHAAP